MPESGQELLPGLIWTAREQQQQHCRLHTCAADAQCQGELQAHCSCQTMSEGTTECIPAVDDLAGQGTPCQGP